MTYTNKGFSLIELSLVLVIIGLVLSALLFGQDLVENARLRRFITQIENYDVAANTFQLRFGDIPGDIHIRRASQYGLEAGGLDGSDGRGDGDGILENGSVTANKAGLGGENLLFWVHLSSVGLIPSQLSTADGSLASAITSDASMRLYLPFDHGREVLDYYVHGDLGRNYYYLSSISESAAITGLPVESPGLTVIAADKIDTKLDDSDPLRGNILARDSLLAPATPAPAAAGICVDSATNRYNLNPDFSAGFSCNLRIRANF